MKPKNPCFTAYLAETDSESPKLEKRDAKNSANAFWETSNADLLLTERDVARRQNLSVRTLQNRRGAGGGIPYLKLGRSVRYRLSDVLAWEQARRRTNTSDGGYNA